VKRTSLTEKMILYFLALGIGSIIVTGYFSFFTARSALLERTYLQLTSVRIAKQGMIERFLEDRLRETSFFTSSEDAIKLAEALLSGNNKYTDTLVEKTNWFLASGYYSGFIILDKSGKILPQPQGQGPGRRGGSGQGPNFWDEFTETIITDVMPAVDEHFKTLTDRDNRAVAGLSLGGTQTYQISQANLDKFANIGVLSAPFGFPGVETGYNGLLTKPDEFNKQVKVFFISMGSKEGPTTGRAIHETLDKAGIKNVYYEAPGTAHEFQTWRKSLYYFAQLLFQN